MRTWQELEALWRANGGNKKPDEISFADLTTGWGFMAVLWGLYSQTEDRRFFQAYEALMDHRVMHFEEHNGYGRPRDFKKGWKSVQKRRLEDHLCACIDHLSTNRGLSVRSACAELAAKHGYYAASFDAAVKKLRNLHAEWLALTDRTKRAAMGLCAVFALVLSTFAQWSSLTSFMGSAERN